MKRLPALLWICGCAVLIAGGLQLAVSPPGPAARPAPEPAADPRSPAGKYHPGAEAAPSGPPCVAAGCHDGVAPHRAGKGAAFLNGHGGALECTACHVEAPPGEAARTQGRRGYAGLGAVDATHRLPAGWTFLARRGEGCRACHGSGSPFPWDRLGYDAGRRAALSDLAQASIIGQGSPWVIPVF